MEVGLLDPELPAQRTGSVREAQRGVGQELSRRDDLSPHWQRSLVGAGDEEQIVREPGQTLRLVGGGAQRPLELLARARAAQREVELGAEQGERRPELVTCVGDEAPLVLDGRL